MTLVNQSDPTKSLTLVVDSPATIILTNSGNPGVNFSLGGSISLSSTTAGGVYAGHLQRYRRLLMRFDRAFSASFRV